jgi:hypothetical protein
MTPEERSRMIELCEQIQVETNSRRFTELVIELNELLERRSEAIQDMEEKERRS